MSRHISEAQIATMASTLLDELELWRSDPDRYDLWFDPIHERTNHSEGGPA